MASRKKTAPKLDVTADVASPEAIASALARRAPPEAWAAELEGLRDVYAALVAAWPKA